MCLGLKGFICSGHLLAQGRRREVMRTSSPPPPASLVTPAAVSARTCPASSWAFMPCLPALTLPSHLPSSLQRLQIARTQDLRSPQVLLNLATTLSRLSCPHPVCFYFLLDYTRRQAEPAFTSLSQEPSAVPAKCELIYR